MTEQESIELRNIFASYASLPDEKQREIYEIVKVQSEKRINEKVVEIGKLLDGISIQEIILILISMAVMIGKDIFEEPDKSRLQEIKTNVGSIYYSLKDHFIPQWTHICTSAVLADYLKQKQEEIFNENYKNALHRKRNKKGVTKSRK